MAEQKKTAQKRAGAAQTDKAKRTAGSQKTRTGAKPSAEKTKTGKAGRTKATPEQTELPVRPRRDENSTLHRVLPYVFVVCAVLLGVCFIFHDGTVGRAIYNVFFGLFGLVAVLIPFLMILFAYKWRSWVADGMQAFESVFGLLFEVFAGALVQILWIASCGEKFNTTAVGTLWADGMKLVGGGAIGGLFGSLLYRGFAAVAGIIFTVVILLLLVFFLLGITPRSVWINIRYHMQMNRERRLAASERLREEREFDYETVSATEAPVRPERNVFDKKVPKPLSESALSNPDFDMNVDETLQADAPAETPAGADGADAPEEGGVPIPDLWPETSGTDRGAAEDAEQAEKRPVYDQYGKIDLGAIFVDSPAPVTPPEEEDDETGGAYVGSLAPECADATLPDADTLTVTTANAGSTAPAAGQPLLVQKPAYRFPPITLLSAPEAKKNEDVGAELRANAQKLIDTLRSFRVNASLISVSRGPTITRYELVPEAGTRVRSIANLVDDISLALASPGIRIEAPIPGKSAVGIEVPNKDTATVTLRELIEDKAFTEAKSKLAVCLGKDVGGAPIIFDIAKMPHLLIAGATGMGKSVCINSLITSILYKATPDEVKLVLIDPKKVEFNIYNGIPHLQIPVVSEPKKAAGALHWAVTEMERRYELIEEVGARKIETYNEIARQRGLEVLPYVVIIIDELADLMMTAPDAVEDSICRLAQKARAAGMHIIIGTQRPSVDVITGLIKANIPSRIAFTVASQVDSRTIIDIAGAEKLIGRGDMLYYPVGLSKPMRAQGAFVSEDEVERITDFVKQNAGENEYDEDIMRSIEREAQAIGQQSGKKGAADPMADDGAGDPKLRDALELATDVGKISTSLLQRKLSIGYGRAAKIIDIMETRGFVSAPDGQKPREVLITKTQFREMVVNNDERLN